MALTVHAYRNRDRTFASLDAELIDYPLTFAGRARDVTPRLAVWAQPERQRCDDVEGRMSGLASVRLRTALFAPRRPTANLSSVALVQPLEAT